MNASLFSYVSAYTAIKISSINRWCPYLIKEESILTQKLNCFSLNANQNLVGKAVSVYLQPKESF